MRIAVLNKDRCKPDKCSPFGEKPCIKYCPKVRTGEKTIELSPEGKNVIITESLCTGCGICIIKCPFNAINIVNLPDPLKNQMTYRYGPDQFSLFRMAIPKKGKVLGLIGQNGIGKSTMLNILSGELRMNLGRFEDEVPNDDFIINYFKGSELQQYFKELFTKKSKIVHKPQNITLIPKHVSGKVFNLLKKNDVNDRLDTIVKQLNLNEILDRSVSVLSGGELQRVAIAAAYLKDADVYLIDEPSSYLDVSERINMAKLIRTLTDNDKTVVVVEHDLAILDYLSDYISLLYGIPGAYGIISHPQGVRVGINIYLNGYIKDENVRIRNEPIRFHERPPIDSSFDSGAIILSYEDLEKTLGDFHLTVDGSEIHAGEIIGILGANGIGKTTFIDLIANKIKSNTENAESKKLKVSIKPQYIKMIESKLVSEIINQIRLAPYLSQSYKKRLINALKLEEIKERRFSELSGGELQRVAIANCLSTEADIYLLDEPSAFLDVEMRLQVAQLLRKSIEELKKSAFVVEHDIITQDFIADSILVFEGTPGLEGKAFAPLNLRDGFNLFLKLMGITFRRDELTKRPRINKTGSTKDAYQKRINEYYYIPK
ncbi:MAG: ribosome biogenesis/translation initiation ATPase RLI [Promethearchaeota archaeon Loki_b31]|nr:MAG: ribosome biogenesis/translation initiation ATPase RLI [Candidatus Lokiarchaeota archaeon Loki_b31]